MKNLKSLFINPEHSIHHAIACIDRSVKGIALVVDETRHLVGTITDGDIRRAVLEGVDLALPVQTLLERRSASPYPHPITASVNSSKTELLQIMKKHVIRHIPILDEENRVVDVVMLSDLVAEYELPLTAVVMAGGAGTRLHPLTKDIPKPMLPVGDRPILELIIQQLRQAGIQQVNIAAHYLADKIINHFGDGKKFGVNLNYVTEDRPLGTAGALGLMRTPQEPILVINGDILTRVDFRAMLAYHQDHKAVLTMAVRKYEFNVPYGVVESEGAFVKNLVEKPILDFFVNAGIYLLDPSVYQYIPNGQRFEMTDLIQLILEKEGSVVSFPIMEYWLDIGHFASYQQAQEDFKNGRFST